MLRNLYLDAGSGSFILTAIATGITGVWFFTRAQFSKLRKKFVKSNNVENVKPDDVSDL